MNRYRVLIDTPDQKGLMYKVSSIFFKNNLNILSNQEFVDNNNNKFFMRSVVVGDLTRDKLHDKLVEILPKQSNIKVISPIRKNIIIMVTKESHALGDILMRYEASELNANIVAVISNYDNLRKLVQKFDIKYHFVTHENLTREQHEEQFLNILSRY